MKSLRSVKAKQCHADQPAVEFPPGSIEENAELLQQTLQALPPSLETIFSWSKLGLACLSGDKVLAEEFIGSCPLEHKKEFSNFHPLFAAVTANSPDVVKLLLSHGANPNIRDESYCTPLMRAAEKKHNDCVLELLRCPRCQVDAIDLRGRTALFYAMRDVDTSLAKMLIAGTHQVCTFLFEFARLHRYFSWRKCKSHITTTTIASNIRVSSPRDGLASSRKRRQPGNTTNRTFPQATHRGWIPNDTQTSG
jgi:hypothetical protein